MFSNRYVQRHVAEKDARSCFICYRPTTAVMVNEMPNADFFYACPTHLSDPGFATLDSASQLALAEQAKKIEEVAELKKQWEEVQAKKKDDNNEKPEGAKQRSPPEPARPQPTIRKVYELHRSVFNLRLGTKRRVAQEKKTQAMLNNPSLFPSAPTHKPT